MSKSIVIDREKAAAIDEPSAAFQAELLYAKAARFQRNIRGAQQYRPQGCQDSRSNSQPEVYNPASGKFEVRS